MSLVGRNRTRRVRHPHHVAAARNLDAEVGRHARLQLQLGVRHVDDRLVGRHVLDDLRLQPDLPDRAVELLAGIRVDAEGHRLARPDAADVGFVDAGVDLHLRQVGGDDEQRRRRHAGRDGLADVDAALNDDAVDRRRDHRVVEVDLILIDRGFRLGDGRLRLRDGRLLRLQAGLRRSRPRSSPRRDRFAAAGSSPPAPSTACISAARPGAAPWCVRGRSGPWPDWRASASGSRAPAASAPRTATDRAARSPDPS